MARDISSFTKRMANQGFKWPRNQSEVRQITKQQLTWLLDGLSVSDTTVSRITDKILPVAKEWQQRPVESIYAVVFLDAIHYHVRSEGQIVKKAVCIAIGLDLDGRKDVLGMWVGENESAKFVTAQPQPSSKNKAGAKSGSSKFSFCKCRAACPTTAADHVRTCGHSDYALGHKDVLQSRPVKNGNTHTASNCWPCRFCNAVENRTGLCSSGRVEHNPVLPDCKGTICCDWFRIMHVK